jgi:excinuclease ABC subunit C
MVTRVTSIEAVACDSGHEAAWLERNLLGPYLGGRRVRQAVKGLSRCLPLALTATGLRGAEREMARARGVTQADRASFADTIGGVLRREPIAVGHVRAQLGQLRDDAARVLAFELAADVNAEIQALEWVTCPQRAASLSGPARSPNGCRPAARNQTRHRCWPAPRPAGPSSLSATPSSPPPCTRPASCCYLAMRVINRR